MQSSDAVAGYSSVAVDVLPVIVVCSCKKDIHGHTSVGVCPIGGRVGREGAWALEL